MSVHPDDLYTKFILLPDSSLSLAEAIQHLPGQREGLYVVFALPDGRYVNIPADSLVMALEGVNKANERTRLQRTSLATLFDRLGFPPLQMDDPALDIDRSPWQDSPTKTAVVLSGQEVVGIIPKPTVFRDFPTPAYGGAQLGEGGVEAQPTKNIFVQTYDGTVRHDPKLKPLQLSKRYTLKVSIRDDRKLGSDVQEAILKYLWADGEQEVTLSVVLQSADFDYAPGSEQLVVKREGSTVPIDFQVKALHEGRCELRILFYKGDSFIQFLTLKYTVVDGDLFASSQPTGRVMESAFTVKPRRLNLTILESRGGFLLVMSKDGRKETATLPLTKNALDALIKEFRKTLVEKVVYMEDPQGKLVYQEEVNITPEYYDKGLRILAEAGYKMYRAIFFPDTTGIAESVKQQLATIGEFFYQMTRGSQTIKIQVFSQHFMLPWGLLYIAHEDEYNLDAVNPKWFLGLSHIIEQIPLWETWQIQSTDTVIHSQDGLNVSLNVNPSVDTQLRRPLVAPQVTFWETKAQAGQVNLVKRQDGLTLLHAMTNAAEMTDALVYFYCHATFADLSEGGPDRSNLIFAPNDKLTLGALKQNAPYTRLLPGEPLVFINACESAELSPLFYDGFVPYFLAKGARGVIGTECEIPAVFASQWAQRFFERFLAGDELGQLMLELRNQFLEQNRNILGLIYALYVDAETRIKPGIS